VNSRILLHSSVDNGGAAKEGTEGEIPPITSGDRKKDESNNNLYFASIIIDIDSFFSHSEFSMLITIIICEKQHLQNMYSRKNTA
jgi:hypothetical protein